MTGPRTRSRLDSFTSFNTSGPSRYSYDTQADLSIGSSYGAAPFVDNDEKYASELHETCNDSVNGEKTPEERS